MRKAFECLAAPGEALIELVEEENGESLTVHASRQVAEEDPLQD